MSTVRAVPILLLLLAACSDIGPDSALGAEFPDGACKLVGNSADRQYCRTTSVQLLANPSVYDGKMVMVQGWATTSGGSGYLYFTRDLLDGAESGGSLILLDGPELQRLMTTVGASSPENPGRLLSVGGRFHLNRQEKSGHYSLKGAPSRFGSMQEITEIRP